MFSYVLSPSAVPAPADGADPPSAAYGSYLARAHRWLGSVGYTGLVGCGEAGRHPIAFCQMLCVLSDADVCIRLFAGIRTRPAVAGMVASRSFSPSV